LPPRAVKSEGKLAPYACGENLPPGRVPVRVTLYKYICFFVVVDVTAMLLAFSLLPLPPCRALCSAKAVLLTDFGYLEELSETSSLEGFGGLAPSMPATAVSTLVSFLSLAGVPPTLGFWAELEVLAGIVKLFLNSGVAGLAVAATLSASTVFSAAYGLLCFKRVFFGPPKVRLEEKLSEPVAVALTLSLVSVALGTYPALLLGALAQLP
jgi:NADH:ubiquinone oxidoreductase subunit 4 (subunit M)